MALEILENKELEYPIRVGDMISRENWEECWYPVCMVDKPNNQLYLTLREGTTLSYQLNMRGWKIKRDGKIYKVDQNKL